MPFHIPGGVEFKIWGVHCPNYFFVIAIGGLHPLGSIQQTAILMEKTIVTLGGDSLSIMEIYNT